MVSDKVLGGAPLGSICGVIYGAPLSGLGTDPSDEPYEAGTHGARGFDEKQQRRVLFGQRVAIVTVPSGNIALACGAVEWARLQQLQLIGPATDSRRMRPLCNFQPPPSTLLRLFRLSLGTGAIDAL